VADAPSSYNLFYNADNGRTYNSTELLGAFGINTATVSIEVLNFQGFYPVVEAPITANTGLYGALASYTVNGEVADQTWTYSPLPLSTAKANGTLQVQATAAQEISDIVLLSGYSAETLAAAGAALEVDRPAAYQAVIAEQQVVSDNLAVQVEAIANATTVDEVDGIVEQPSGTLVSGRGGAGPDDLHPSYFTVLTNLPPGIGEPELEIYIPGTDTIIPYDAGLPEPYKFDSAGDCYNSGDYRTTIRVAATGQVLSTVTPAFGPIVPIEWTYNPTIPSTGSSSSARR
jgi:hypothetical protein